MHRGLAAIAVICGLSGLSVAAVGPKQALATTHEGNPRTAHPTTGEQATTAEQKTRLVLRQLHALNTEEIRDGRVAEQRGEAAEVKHFGSRMVSDHTGLERSLAEVAKKEGFDLVGGEASDPIQSALSRAAGMRAQELASTEGRAFDVTYLAPEAYQHQFAISVVEEGQKYAQGDAKRALDSAHQVLSGHLDMARSLVQRMSLQGLGVGGGPERPAK